MVLWPPGEYHEHPTPPSIRLEEGSYDGKNWQNTRIALTLDKLPNLVQDLMIAYSKALELQASEEVEEPSEEVAVTTPSKPADPVGFLMSFILKLMQPNVVYSRDKIVELVREKHDWCKVIEVEQAVQQLLYEKKIAPKFEKLTLVGFTKAWLSQRDANNAGALSSCRATLRST